MKFTAIFLTGAALAKNAFVLSGNGQLQSVNPTPGRCTLLHGDSVQHASTTPDIGLKFYTGPHCDGEQVATSSGKNFRSTGDYSHALSVKTVSQEELTNEEASYYIYWGRY
jgi:hypothetical protein